MENFIDFDTENMGGCSSFEFAPVNDINTIAEPVDSKINTAIGFKSGKSFYTGLSVIGNLEFTEDIAEQNAGVLYKTKVSGIIPKLTSDYQSLFAEMVRTRFIVKVTDNNGNERICGKKDAGMKFNFSQATGSKAADKNGYEFTFFIDHPLPSPFYVV